MRGDADSGKSMGAGLVAAAVASLLLATAGCDRGADRTVPEAAVDGGTAPDVAGISNGTPGLDVSSEATGTIPDAATGDDPEVAVGAASRAAGGPGPRDIRAAPRAVQEDVADEARMSAEATDVDATGARAGAPATDTPTTGAEANARRREAADEARERP